MKASSKRVYTRIEKFDPSENNMRNLSAIVKDVRLNLAVGRQRREIRKIPEYQYTRTLGKGRYGTIVEAENREGKVAVEIIRKKRLPAIQHQMIEIEQEMLRGLEHPHIIRLLSFYDFKKEYFLVTNPAHGGSLLDEVDTLGRLLEKNALSAIEQVLEAVKYLHGHDIVHRDVNPRNLLYPAESVRSPLILTGFCCAKKLRSPEEKLTGVAGTIEYGAPELLRGKEHGKPVDMWSVGVVTYHLLCGYPPFGRVDVQHQLKRIEEPMKFGGKNWEDVSELAQDFIKTLSELEPKQRATCTQTLDHSWLKGKTTAD